MKIRLTGGKFVQFEENNIARGTNVESIVNIVNEYHKYHGNA